MYIEADLEADYSVQLQHEYIDRQLAKLNQMMKKKDPNHEDLTNENIDFRKLFGWRNDDPEKEVREMNETLRMMEDDQFYRMERDQGLTKEMEENVGKYTEGGRTKFKNR